MYRINHIWASSYVFPVKLMLGVLMYLTLPNNTPETICNVYLSPCINIKINAVVLEKDGEDQLDRSCEK